MSLFLKKQTVVEARQLLDDLGNHIAIVQWVKSCGGDAYVSPLGSHLTVVTREGDMRAEIGDWVIREPFPTLDRQFYPCKPHIFAATYDRVETNAKRTAEVVFRAPEGIVHRIVDKALGDRFAELLVERDLARDVAVQLEQEVAVLTAERDGEIERLRQARQDAYDSYVSALNENLGLRQQVEHLSTSWGFVSGGE